MLKIDAHTHILPEKLPKFTEKFGYGDFIYLDHQEDGSADMIQGDKYFRTIKENCWGAEKRFEDYDQFKVQAQVVCTVPVMFSYWAKPKHTKEVAEFLNEDIAATCAKHPKRYIGLGTLPMQDTDLAIKELERCIRDLGLKGVQIGSNINDYNLSDKRFFPFYEAAEELGAAILVHPWQMMGMDKMRKYWLPWLVGMPAETSRAICSMVFGGVFNSFPDLRVNFAHAGGSFMGTIGRIEHGYNCRPDLVAIDNPNNPRTYLGKFWVDSITHDPVMLKYVIDLIGSNKICMGSDYPFPLGDLEFGKFIEDMDISEKDKENIFANATLDWLGMSIDELK